VTTMRSFDERLDTYLDVVLTVGVNLQRDQSVVITAGGGEAAIEDVAPVARRLTRKAYEMGARHVFVQWDDGDIARSRVLLAPEDSLTEVPLWRIHWLEDLSDRGAAFIRLMAPDPTLFDGVDATRQATVMKFNAQAGAKLAMSQATLRHPWTVAAYASRAWARQVHPDLSEADAVAALWDYIFAATRADESDPVGAWRSHLANLNESVSFMNSARFKRLHYRGPGTDLRLDLPARQAWISGGNSRTPAGIAFVPNLPTEEVFCLPVRSGVEGVVSSTMPLNYNGTLIEGIKLRFEAGRIVEYEASAGRDSLQTIIETDEGSRYLGEVALVPANSPVNIGAPVRNTLFDENASCHLAIGRAYPVCIEGGATMSQEELAANGANYSLAHVDFMIGSEQLDIDGETASGALVPVFHSGMFSMVLSGGVGSGTLPASSRRGRRGECVASGRLEPTLGLGDQSPAECLRSPSASLN
jgi:aminopeptidase